MVPTDVATARGITEVLHFTTTQGLIGILASKKLLSRKDLSEDEYLENIRYYNTVSRSRDIDWIGHVSMSLTVVNSHMLSKSMSWHSDEVSWFVLAFSTEILDHEDIEFCTTNNVYPVVRRAQGIAGLEAMFAPSVPWGIYGSIKPRASSMPENQTTDFQAELLYPGAVDLSYLRAIYVADQQQVAFVRSLVAAVNVGGGPNLSSVKVEYNPDVFVNG